MTPIQYLKEHDLWDISRLKQHAQHNNVYVIQSFRFPNLVMLHYTDACQHDNLWTTFSKMCRGLILDLKNNRVLAYPFEKFFNLGQTKETQYNQLVTLGGFETSEKLDGSLIIGFIDPNTDKFIFTTKGSFDANHSAYANMLQLTSEQRITLRAFAEHGTLMFELIAKPFQIVVDYKKKGYKEGLYLIGYRHNISNKLASFDELVNMVNVLNLPTFKTYQFNSIDQLLDATKRLSVLNEGFVIRFKDDLMVKIKGDAYLKAHRFISHLSDKHILEAVGDNTASGLARLAPEEYREDILEKINHFQKRVVYFTDLCYNYFKDAPKQTSRKDFAIWVVKHVPSYLKGFMFQLLDGKQINRKQLCKVLEQVDNVSGITRI